MSIFEYERDAVHVRARCSKASGGPEETRKFSVDPNLTSFETLKSILSRAFDLSDFYSIFFLSTNEWLPLMSDWDLDAAIISASEPHLNIKVSESRRLETNDSGSVNSNLTSPTGTPSSSGLSILTSAVTSATSNKVGVNFLKKHVEKTLPQLSQRFQRALNLAEDSIKAAHAQAIRRSPVGDTEFQSYMNGIGELERPRELRLAIYQGGVEPQLRKVVWKHILGVYPANLNGKQRIEYIKGKSAEYYRLKQTWMDIILQGSITDDIKFITNMVRKDVLRTDRQHGFYAGDGNKNVSVLFNILTTYALNHPSVGYCQGMSDLLSPILVTMLDEAQSYITFCALMKRLYLNFHTDGKTMTKKFNHLSEGLMYYDPEFFTYLKLNNADDLLFCYRWLLLELKREFAFEDSCRALEVLWSSLPPRYPNSEKGGLELYEVRFAATAPLTSRKLETTPYAKVAALRKRTSSSDMPGFTGLASTSLNRTMSTDASGGSRPRIQSAGCAEDRLNQDQMKKSLSLNDRGKKVKDLSDFYKLTNEQDKKSNNNPNPSATSPPPPPPPPKEKPPSSVINPSDSLSNITSSTKRSNPEESDPFDDVIGYSQANGGNISVVYSRLPPPTEFGDGNPFLIFLCLALLIQHRGHVMHQKFDYQEIAMYFDRLIRRHDVEKTLHIARKLFAEYLNEDWSVQEDVSVNNASSVSADKNSSTNNLGTNAC